MPIKKASWVQSLWIAIRALSATFWLSFRGVVESLLWGIPRGKVNQMMLKWANTLIQHADIQLTVRGLEGVKWQPGRAYVIMCNHVSLYDIPVIYAAFPEYNIRMIAKKELFRIPFFGRAMSLNEFVSVDRKNREQAILDLDHARQKLENGIILWTAPEGTRSRTGALQPFKKGVFMLALKTEAMIIPVYIQGTERVLPAKTRRFYTGVSVTVNVCEPIDSRDYTIEKKEVLMEKVRESFLSVSNQ